MPATRRTPSRTPACASSKEGPEDVPDENRPSQRPSEPASPLSFAGVGYVGDDLLAAEEEALRELEEEVSPARAPVVVARQPSTTSSGGETHAPPAASRLKEDTPEMQLLAMQCVNFEQCEQVEALESKASALEVKVRQLTNENQALAKRLSTLKDQDASIVSLRRSVDSANDAWLTQPWSSRPLSCPSRCRASCWPEMWHVESSLCRPALHLRHRTPSRARHNLP